MEKKGKDIVIRQRKYDFDYDFFHVIDTEEKAYWLGFLMADGCITKNTVKLELQEQDKDRLILLKKHINAADNLKLRYREDRKSYILILNSKKTVEDLKVYGCTERKTFTLQFPEINSNFVHHYMRGYFDGDGCIYCSKDPKKSSCVTIVGNDKFIPGYQDILYKNIGKSSKTKFSINYYNPRILTFFIGGNVQIKKIYDFLYKDATVFMKRKKDKFEKIIGRLNSKSLKN